MNSGDALVIALCATMALMLASRALRRSRLPLKTQAAMALVWMVLIIGGAAIASWWQA